MSKKKCPLCNSSIKEKSFTNQIDILESVGTNQYKYDEIEIFALSENS